MARVRVFRRQTRSGTMATPRDALFRRGPWREEAIALRRILLQTGLAEAVKWRNPCYTHGGRNICIVQRMKDFLALLFLKGALLPDPDGLLERQGPNSRTGFRMRFTSVSGVARREQPIRDFVAAAIRVEEAGLRVEPAPDLDLPAELASRFAEDPELRAAFDDLTPGRQRGYALHFGSARKPETRAARIERCRPRILAGKGLRDR